MSPRIICPHCHCPIDPLALEEAASAQAHYRICPECDGAMFVGREYAGDPGPALRKDAFSDQELPWL